VSRRGSNASVKSGPESPHVHGALPPEIAALSILLIVIPCCCPRANMAGGARQTALDFRRRSPHVSVGSPCSARARVGHSTRVVLRPATPPTSARRAVGSSFSRRNPTQLQRTTRPQTQLASRIAASVVSPPRPSSLYGVPRTGPPPPPRSSTGQGRIAVVTRPPHLLRRRTAGGRPRCYTWQTDMKETGDLRRGAGHVAPQPTPLWRSSL